MCSHWIRLAVVLSPLILSGCHTPSEKQSDRLAEASQFEKPANLQQHIRNNSASLLYDLLNDEKNLSKILIIKRESDTLHNLVKRISEAAAVGAKQLEQLEKQDASLNLHVIGLPSGEAATREAISKTKEHGLLHSKGTELEFKLLLTQTEGLNYGAHLAKVAAANESKPESARIFSDIQNSFETLYREVCDQLQKRRVSKTAE